MNILAIDSSAKTASAAVLSDSRLAGMYTINTANTHSETLLPMIDSLLTNLKLTIDSLDLLAVSAGPGSFTGVRIGVSTIKGLAFGKKIPCVGVSTIEALAENLAAALLPGELAVPVMDARRSQIYNAIFRKETDGSLSRLCDDRLIELELLKNELSEHLEKYTSRIFFTGDGYKLAVSAVKLCTDQGFYSNADNSFRIAETPEILRYQNAFSVAVCAERKYNLSTEKSIFTDSALNPVYLRASQAERERLAREKK